MDLPGVAEVAPKDLNQYLKSAGWTERQSRRSDVIHFERSENGQIYGATVVMDTTYADYVRRTAEVLDTIASVENRSAISILNELLMADSDVIRFRVVSNVAQHGVIPFEDNIRYQIAQRTLLLSSAHSTLDPRKHFPRLSQDRAVRLLESCMAGQTERGSYVTTLAIPVRHEPGETFAAEPYARRVTATMMGALNETSTLVQGDNKSALVDRAAVGISANFLGALASMKPDAKSSSVEIEMAWSRNRPMPSLGSCVRFRHESFQMIEEAWASLRERTEPTSVELGGYIVSLKRQENKKNAPGTIVIVTRIEGLTGTYNVSAKLYPADYQAAVAAHKAAAGITVRGTLAREGRSWRLSGAKMLGQLPPGGSPRSGAREQLSLF
jgi:hypothetical protein